ncbi:MAG: bifunctional hydroxymethylpyrimidine kinase/phosphomethylpyrimidine kinase [Flavobacteriaceae bacterium]
MAAPVVIVSSLVASGRVGGRASSFALERLGFETALLPTVTMAHHPGHGPVTRMRPAADDFARALAELDARIGEPAAILTGYFGEAAQAEAAAAYVARHPHVPFLCDPVIGDDGALYVGEALAATLRDALLPLASIATPNLFELEWLAGAACSTPQETAAAAAALKAPTVAVTSAPPMLRDHVGTLLRTPDETLLAESRAFPNAPHGTGDLFAGLLLGFALRLGSAAAALPKAVGATAEAVAFAAREGADELALVPVQQMLREPRVPVPLRRLG